MKHSLLVSFISTLAFSFGLISASPTLSVKRGLQVPIFDAMGIASNKIVCRKHAIHRKDSSYNKREAYAAVAQAMMHIKQGNHAVVGCESLKVCSRYPKNFNDNTIKFKTNGPYLAYPILSNGQIFKGGRKFTFFKQVILYFRLTIAFFHKIRSTSQ